MAGTGDELEARCVALEETREAHAYELRRRELAMEERKAGREGMRTLTVGVVSAAVGAVASLGAAYLAGAFDIQGRRIESRAAASLEEQRFRFELINWALAEEDDRAGAQRLRFMVEVGLPDRLDREAILHYAEREEERLRTGSDERSLIPCTKLDAAAQDVPAVPGNTALAAPTFRAFPSNVVQAMLARHRVILVDPGPDRDAVAEVLREITGIGAREAESLASAPGAIVAQGINPEEAALAAEVRRVAGADVRLDQIAPIRTMR